MQPLERTLRGQLERALRKARRVAEEAAWAALNGLGVAEASAPGFLSEDQRALRRRLRAHARSLGDTVSGTASLSLLTHEVAYEHWHRMLFARFLAENSLLMYDGVAITLEESDALAEEQGAASGWELAARLAAGMLPQVFRIESPVFALRLAPEYQRELEGLLAGLAPEVFHASDSLGWVYQFWQADNKERINQSEVKIGARELPAVTQLFTEPYMVSFLLDNALGAWWAARRLSAEDLRTATSEAELREKAALPGVPLTYLRFVQDDDGTWTPAAGTFDAWPKHLKDLKTLDPCCGSGHFLVSLLLMLVPMRMEREGLSAREAVDAVLRENVHGLEIDQRCVELAAFALALAAWNYPGAGGYRKLPELQLACSGLAVHAAKEEWKQLGLGRQNLTIALDWIYDTFHDGPVLGSLLNPAKSAAAKVAQWSELSGLLESVLRQEATDERQEAAVVAHGLAKAAPLLAGQYHWVVTNVPYLARGKQSDVLRDFCERHYPEAKNDLATVFLDRCLDFTRLPGRQGALGGTVSLVLPQNWLFLTSYRRFREKLLQEETWHLIARLGPQAFQTPMWDFNVQLLALSSGNTAAEVGGLFADDRAGNRIRGLDVSGPRAVGEKVVGLLRDELNTIEQHRQLNNPDSRVILEGNVCGNLLGEYCDSHEGLTTGDIDRFVRKIWEIEKSIIWSEYIQNAAEVSYYRGRTDVIYWEREGEAISEFPGSFIKGRKAWTRVGLRITQMQELPVTLYTGEIFGKNAATVVPKNKSFLPAIWCFCGAPEYNRAVRKIDQKLNVTIATLVKVPFDLDHWTKVAAERYPNGLPQPYTEDPTQWIFHGHPCGSVVWDEETRWTADGSLRSDATVLQVAVARLLSYRWPAELDPEMELADEQRAWVKRCEGLLPYADADGIVCIPAVRGEAKAEDRLLNLLAAAYGDAWTTGTLGQLLASSDHAGKSLESWLRDKFFVQHCKLFQNRPFIWHIWDGLRDGFAALVNYHRLDHKMLETLIYTYLGDWIRTQKDDIQRGVDGAQEKLAAAESLQKKLELILEGETPYDIFVRWKPLEEQPLGWNPDLNDGVRLNIRPFLTVDDVGKKGAGVLRDKPNIHWNKDRGKDVESAPWYKLFKGDRINDHHLSLDEKRRARE